MGYYLRAFCTSADLPPLRTVFKWVEAQGVRVEAPSSDVDERNWKEAEIVYKPDKQPIVADATSGELLEEEVEEFTEFLADVDDSP